MVYYSNKKTLWQGNNRNSVCKSCRTAIANVSKKRNSKLHKNPAWRGYEDIPYSWFSKYFLRGSRKRTGSITIEQVWDLYKKQLGKCALSGVNIGFNDLYNGHSASIDRIDSKKEYDIDNIQLVHKDVNLMKNHFDQTYFLETCKRISEFTKSN
jgi:hypothetical protein